MKLTFIEAPNFSQQIASYLNDGEYIALQKFLLKNPEAGDVIQGTGGFRKLRWHDANRNKGKRGGLRIIYYYFEHVYQIWLIMISNKNEATNLTAKQKTILKAAIEQEKILRKNEDNNDDQTKYI